MTPISFRNSLAETISWVMPRMDIADPRWSMRSLELRPSVDETRDGRPGFFNNARLIADVVRKRSALLSQNMSRLCAKGQLLTLDYANTNFNEVTEIETRGFFDFADNPPWDLWIGDCCGLLVSWIPEEFVDIVDDAIEIELFEVLRWVDDVRDAYNLPRWLTLA